MIKSYKSFLIAVVAVFMILQSVVCFADFPSGFFPTLSSGDLYYGQDMSANSADMGQKILRSMNNDKVRLAGIQAQPKSSYVSLENGVITVIYDIGDPKELFGVTLSKRGVNSIFDYNEFFTIDKGADISNYKHKYNYKRDAVTDTHSPYVVHALYNAGGSNLVGFGFTGGNHSSVDINGLNSPTGSTQSIQFIIDGVQCDTYQGYAAQVDIIYENHIQASNTIQLTGIGRNVIREVNHICFDGEKWKSSINITSFEPVAIYRYYGLQFDTRSFGENVMYVYEDGRISLYDADVASASTDKACKIINVFGDKFDVEIAMTSDFGSFNETGYSAFNESYSKTYFNIVNSSYNSLVLNQGDTFSLEGYYKFTSSK